MGYLIDTNIISELIKSNPNKQVLEWFKSVHDADLYISVLTIGEIRKGIDRISCNKKREKIRLWLECDLTDWFGNRILPINYEVANKWGVLQSRVSRTLPAIDSLIAATALHSDLIVVTRNSKDFEDLNLEIINPFNYDKTIP